MIHCKRAFIVVAAGLALSAGNLRADDATPVAAAPTTPTVVATAVAMPAKAAKADSPTVTAMKAAMALADAGKTDEAIAAFEKIGVLKSKKSEGWRLNDEGLAYLEAATPVPDKAVAVLEKAVAVDSSNYTSWNNLGSAYELNDQILKAKDAYQKSIDAAKEADASSAKAEGNLAALQPKLDKLSAKDDADKSAAPEKADDSAKPAAATTPAAGADQSK